jgi:hypothetical protein
MPYYKGVLDKLISNGHTQDAQEVAGRILSLRNRLKKQLPQRNVLSSLLLATWNIRELGADEKFGTRLEESLLYIAEIVSHFDLIAMQEVNENLSNLQALMKLLGNWWDYLVTDVTLGSSGNSERIAFIYDSRKVRFDHLAGELALPDGKKKKVVQPALSLHLRIQGRLAPPVTVQCAYLLRQVLAGRPSPHRGDPRGFGGARQA